MIDIDEAIPDRKSLALSLFRATKNSFFTHQIAFYPVQVDRSTTYEESTDEDYGVLWYYGAG